MGCNVDKATIKRTLHKILGHLGIFFAFFCFQKISTTMEVLPYLDFLKAYLVLGVLKIFAYFGYSNCLGEQNMKYCKWKKSN